MGDTSHYLISLLTLTILEIVLGVDNLIFIAIVSSRLKPEEQPIARRLGLMFAWVTRLILLAFAVWIAGLTAPLINILDFSFSGRDLLLLGGGLFLLVKATQEIHKEIEESEESTHKKIYATLAMVIVQIGILDIIFSLDSVITAIGLTQNFWIMATAITIAILVMIFASEPLARFVERHPTIKMLALSFLILIGTVLVADGFHFHVPRAYVYFAVCFSILVEMLNMVRRKKVV